MIDDRRRSLIVDTVIIPPAIGRGALLVRSIVRLGVGHLCSAVLAGHTDLRSCKQVQVFPKNEEPIAALITGLFHDP
jgi:hypothetical protein